jgi:hypothetical protein
MVKAYALIILEMAYRTAVGGDGFALPPRSAPIHR